MKIEITCPCCGYKTNSDSYDICDVCDWEDDPVQADDPDLAPGANEISLREAQKTFLKRGFLSAVNFERDLEWKPLQDYSPNEIKLLVASFYGNEDEVREHISKVENVDVQDYSGHTSLMRAARRGHLQIVRILVDSGANINAKGKYAWSALSLAIANGHIEIAKKLIEAGADPDLLEENGLTSRKVARQFSKNIDQFLSE